MVAPSLVALLAASSAAALNWREDMCNAESNFRFVGSGWDTVVDGYTKRYWALTGMNQWQNVRESDGAQMLSSREDAAATVDVVLDSTPNGNSANYGWAWCNRIELLASMNGSQLRTTAAHELGHIFGLRHVGRSIASDAMISWDGKQPVMNACTNPLYLSFSQDDEAHVTRHRAVQRAAMANPSFERGLSHWGLATQDPATPPSLVESTVSGGSEGLGLARFRPQRGADHVYQTVHASNGKLFWLAARYNVRQDPYARQQYGSTSGNTRLDLQVRPRNYAARDSNDCDYSSGKDEDTVLPTTSAFTTHSSRTLAASTGWTFGDTSAYTIPDTHDAVELRVRLFSDVKTPAGALTWVNFDNARPYPT